MICRIPLEQSKLTTGSPDAIASHSALGEPFGDRGQGEQIATRQHVRGAQRESRQSHAPVQPQVTRKPLEHGEQWADPPDLERPRRMPRRELRERTDEEREPLSSTSRPIAEARGAAASGRFLVSVPPRRHRRAYHGVVDDLATIAHLGCEERGHLVGLRDEWWAAFG